MDNSLIRPSGALCILLALMVLYVPLEWLFAAFLAGMTHELSHAAAIKICGGTVTNLRLGSGGAVMSAGALEGWRQPFCLIAGPLGGLSLLFVARWIPRTALCAVVHSIYNLLPGDHLDGGRILKWLAERTLPEQLASKVCWWFKNIVCVGLIVLGLACGWILKLGWPAVLLAGWVLYRVGRSKRA